MNETLIFFKTVSLASNTFIPKVVTFVVPSISQIDQFENVSIR